MSDRSFTVGNKVDVWDPIHGLLFVGTITKAGPTFDIMNENGDQLNDVDPFYVMKSERVEPIRQVEMIRSKENEKLYHEKTELEQKVQAMAAEIEKLKQENLTYVRLIKELSTAQRASIKGGRKRKTKRNQNGPAIFSADF